MNISHKKMEKIMTSCECTVPLTQVAMKFIPPRFIPPPSFHRSSKLQTSRTLSVGDLLATPYREVFPGAGLDLRHDEFLHDRSLVGSQFGCAVHKSNLAVLIRFSRNVCREDGELV